MMARTSVWEKSHECRSKRVAVFAVVDCHDLNKDTKPDTYCCHLPFLSFFLSFSSSPFFSFRQILNKPASHMENQGTYITWHVLPCAVII